MTETKEIVHLHNHSNHSFLDGQASVKNMVARAKELGLDALAITNHGNIFAHVEFYNTCKKNGIKPILGCLLKGQEIMTSTGVKSVEDVQIGDMVLTHKGRFRKVLRTSTRLHRGKLYDIELAGYGGRKLTLTDEHPVLIRNNEGGVDWIRADEILDGRKGKCVGINSWQSYVALPKLESFNGCNLLRSEDYLPDDIRFVDGVCTKIVKKNKYDHYKKWLNLPEIIHLDEELCYLLGLLTAEGSFGTYANGSLNGEIRWSFHIDETEYAETVLESMASRFGLKGSVYQRPDRHLQEVYFSCMPLAYIFSSLVGIGSCNKRVPLEVFKSGPTLTRWAFLDGVLDGDGKNPDRLSNVGRQSTLKTASKDLAWGVRQLLADQGHWVNVAEVIEEEVVYYQVPVSLKRKYARSIQDHNYVWKPVRSVNEREDSVQVFNFEVEEDNSYVSDFILHNCEFYLVYNHEESVAAKARHAHHLVVLAENEEGWLNLCRLTTLANRSFYYKPRIDLGMLERHREGLIVLTACMHGPVSYYLFDKMTWPKDGEESQLKEAANIPEAYRYARALQCALKPGQLFLEVQDGGIPEQIGINQRVRQMAHELGLETVATQDAHYVLKEDAEAHGFLKAMAFGKSAVEAGSHGFSTQEFYLKNREQVLAGDIREDEVDRTRDIAARCDVTLPLHQIRLPQYLGVEAGQTPIDVLKQKVNDGWDKRGIHDNAQGDYRNRVHREVSDIERAGLADYFLIVGDITDFCHENDIMLGSRGSAGGSLVSYLLGITNLDPIKYGLMWERFYNAGRVGSMPDIDTDVEKGRRDEVIDYIKGRFGENRVAQLVTLSSLGAKGVLKDVFRVAGIDVDTQNRISGLVPAKNEDHASITLVEACRMVPELNKYAVDNEQFDITRGGKILRTTSWAELFDIARRLEGCYKTTGVHAAAVVIADRDFEDAGIPLVKGATKDHLICGWDMDAVDEFGLLKVDILGLATLSVIKTTLRLIKERHGIDVDIQHIPLDDPKVAALICAGRNEGIFQIESVLGKTWSKKCQPGATDPRITVDEIAELVSIIRPACLETGMAGTYANIKSGEETPTYIHPILKPILSPTKGVLLYQEQVMAICQVVAGMDLQEADKFRKVIGKKKPEELKLKRQQFMEGAKATVPDNIAEEIWSWVERQAGYGFNKSHAVGYAMLAYQTAWLKANYYIEFLCANLVHAKDKANQQRTPHDVIASFVNDGKLHDTAIIPPTLARSDKDFTILDDSTISFGFSHIKGVGAASMKAVSVSRSATSFDDFLGLARTHKMKSNVVEALICAGVLDKFGIPRRAMKNQYKLLDELTAKERDALPPDMDLLDAITFLVAEENVEARKSVKAFTPNVKRRAKVRDLVEAFGKLRHQDSMAQILLWEKDYLGTTISGSLADLKRAMQARNSCIEIGRGGVPARTHIDLCVVIESMREHTIKSGNNAGQVMAFLILSDSSYRLDNVCVFSDAYARIKGSVEPGDVVGARGVMSDRGLIINSMRRL